ncbi:MBL fold metallo-hydrolase [Kineosporia sp. R_H_3]|uniref:MBL fold metallo-hydrolase n=1 Tax=Kineosporia sp. R_H_3 TaxID=1961848 RepID=UPI000B4BE0D2|nr:MBL fold metallo-hydrolase [Kineosporia sp. R_H_3]
MGTSQPGHGPSRRQVVLGLGGGGFALALLGACSSDGSAPGSGAGSGSGTATAASPAPGTPSAPEPSSDAPGTPEAGVDGAPGWARVNLGFVSAYVLVRGREAAVVDTGVAGSADAIGAVLDAAGPGWAGVRHVVLTHHHRDHAGSLPDVLTRAGAATGYVGAADLEQVAAAPRPLTPLEDGAEVFGLQLVGTPGHTAGHMSVFDPETGVLVAGDAIRNTDGLQGSSPPNTADPAAAQASVGRLARLPVRTVLFGHGDPLTTDVVAALRELAG